MVKDNPSDAELAEPAIRKPCGIVHLLAASRRRTPRVLALLARRSSECIVGLVSSSCRFSPVLRRNRALDLQERWLVWRILSRTLASSALLASIAVMSCKNRVVSGLPASA